jgi:tetratricopeptide (TPR) repeat protein
LLCIFARPIATRFHLFDDYRPDIWKTSLIAIGDYPVTGYGLGNFEMAYQRHAFAVEGEAVRFGHTTEFAHNEYLQAAVEAGLPGFGMLVAGILFILCCPTRPDSPLQRSAKAGLLSFSINACFNPIWHMPFLTYVTLLWAALLRPLTPSHEMPIDARPPGSRGLPWKPLGGGIVLAGTALLVLWLGLRSHWATRQKWEHILRFDPGDAAAWSGWASQQKALENVIHGDAEAVRHSPGNFYYQEALALALESTQTPDNVPLALQHYEDAFRRAPTRATDALAIGRLFFRDRDAVKALSWFQKACALEPLYWQAQFWVARTNFQLGKEKLALQQLRSLQFQHAAFLPRYARMAQPLSAYEGMILAYDADVVNQELRRYMNP